jgi:hypothetical protein
MNLLKSILDNLKSELDFEILGFYGNIPNEKSILIAHRSFKVLNDCLLNKYSLIKIQSEEDFNFVKFLSNQGFFIELNGTCIESEEDIVFEKGLIYEVG